jgi:CheY-like chemotaxis protein
MVNWMGDQWVYRRTIAYQGLLVLLVEDDLALRQMTGQVLELTGYQVVTAPNGAEGLAALSQSAVLPSIIISDILMPKMDGWQLFEVVRSKPQWSQIPFLFITGHPNFFPSKGSVVEVLVKPFYIDKLLYMVAQALEKS